MNILRTAALAATVISSNIFAADSVNVSVTGNILPLRVYSMEGMPV